MTDLVVNEVALPAAKWTVKRIWQELGYMFWYKSNIGDLNDQVQQLRHKRDGIKLEEKSAREASKIIDGQVTDWLVKADKKIEETETSFSEQTVASKAACCNGWLPNLKCRHSLGRKAKKMTLEVEELFATEPKTISHPAPHPEVESRPTEDPTQPETSSHEGASSSGTSNHEQPAALLNFDSRSSTFGDVMEALRGNQINPIIICGLGGMGKTTLMGQVHEKAKKEGLFDEYTKATFKESLDVIQIQGELAEYLGLPLEEKERGPRASKLRQRLSEGSKKILVMLDNVWTTTPDFLWDIGIPPSCKLLVTSRQQDLFKDMDTRRNFPIHGLPDREAWSLFKKTAGSSIESDPGLHVVAEKILKECAGLPIAISTVGTALKGESIGIWKNALKELEKASPENVDGVIEHVYGPINFSYQSLPSQEVKLFFLLCCIFKGSADIQIEDLVRYGIGLGLFIASGSMLEGRNRVETLIQKLKSRFLLLESDQKGCVRMHDLVRDVGVHIASEEFVEKKNVGVEKRIVVRDKARTVEFMDWPKNISSEETTYCTSLSINGHCQFFWLRTDSPLEPPPTSNRMKDLKVLAIVGNSYYHLLSLDSVLPSLAVLRNLQTLRLERCAINCYVSVIGELKTLVILSLRESDIKQLPDTFKNLSYLRLLDLSECKKLEGISPGVLSSLSRLEELYMVQSYYIQSYFRGGWNSEILAELLSLPRLTTLQVALPAVDMVLASSLFNKLESFKIAIRGIRDTPCFFGSYRQDANYLEVCLVDASATVGSGITSMIKKTEILDFVMGRNVTEPQVLKVLDAVCSAKMRSLRLYMNDTAEYLCDTTLVKTTTPHDSSAIFPVLNSLEIAHASRMKEIFHGELLKGSLKELRSLKLTDLSAVTYIWKTNSRSEWGVLRNIIGVVQELYISRCESLEEIVAFEYDNEEVINFQSLVQLTLSLLPNFTGMTKNISNGTERPPEDSSREKSNVIIQPLFDTKVHFPVLTKLEIEYMHLKEIWNDLLSAESFCELKSLRVKECRKLLHVVPTHMQNRLQKLEYIFASSCDSLEEIFEFRKSERIGTLALTISESGNQGTQINKMMSFKPSRQAFQNLGDLSVMYCRNLRTLMSPSVARGLVKLHRLSIRSCDKIEEIVAATAGGEEAMDGNMFPQLTSLSLNHLPNLRSFSSIGKCENLRALFTPSIARGLVKLQTLSIYNCKKIEEIIAATAEGEETGDDNLFPQMNTLKIEDLGNLRSFSEGKYNFKWPRVGNIMITGCYNMKKFCSGSLSTRKEVNIHFRGASESSVLEELNNSRLEI